MNYTRIVKCTKDFPIEIFDLIGGSFGENASDLHKDVMKRLKNAGFPVSKEFAVESRGDGRKGRVDVVINLDGELIGVELDGKSARRKSIYKLQNNFKRWAVAVRY